MKKSVPSQRRLNHLMTGLFLCSAVSVSAYGGTLLAEDIFADFQSSVVAKNMLVQIARDDLLPTGETEESFEPEVVSSGLAAETLFHLDTVNDPGDSSNVIFPAAIRNTNSNDLSLAIRVGIISNPGALCLLVTALAGAGLVARRKLRGHKRVALSR